MTDPAMRERDIVELWKAQQLRAIRRIGEWMKRDHTTTPQEND